MQHYPGPKLNAVTLREELAAIEAQIQFDPKNNTLIDRYLTYARKVREIEYRENGYVTPRNQTLKNATLGGSSLDKNPKRNIGRSRHAIDLFTCADI